MTGPTAPARRLAAALEPFVGSVYFAPECHDAYEALGFAGSSGEFNGVAGPDGPAYFTSRGSLMGQVPGEVVAAAFGVFNPAAVVPSVAHGWSLTDAPTICRARTDGAVAQLRRVLGERPDGVETVVDGLRRAEADLQPAGKPLFAGARAQPLTGDPLADAWQLGDRLREFRGDAHTAAWTAVGYDATEIGMVSELYWGLPARSYVRTRAWTDDDLDAAEARLTARGHLAEGGLTEEGRRQREMVEVATDTACGPIVEAMGADLGPLVDVLSGWSLAVQDARGYPPSGPHDLAEAASGRP